MAEKQQSNATGTAPAAASAAAAAAVPTSGVDGNTDSPTTVAEYKKSQQRLRQLVEKRRQIEKRLNELEDDIGQKETAYLESTPSGNIVTGFDNYLKGTSGAAAQRRKTGTMDQNRVFSKSSISYRPNNGDSTTPGSTPASHAATPMSASFRDSGNATPTAGGATKGGMKSKKKEATEDSENDWQGNKKRTNFGASRK